MATQIWVNIGCRHQAITWINVVLSSMGFRSIHLGAISHCSRYQSVKWVRHDDVIKWKHFPRYWPSVWGIHRSPVNSPHKGQWRGALLYSLICAWINGWVNNREDGDLRRLRAHYDAIVMNSSSPGGRWVNSSRRCDVHMLLWRGSYIALCNILLHVIWNKAIISQSKEISIEFRFVNIYTVIECDETLWNDRW